MHSRTSVLLLIVWVSMLLASCSSSNDVVSDSWIQKRKHRQGFHFDLANITSKVKKGESHGNTDKKDADIKPSEKLKADSVIVQKDTNSTFKRMLQYLSFEEGQSQRSGLSSSIPERLKKRIDASIFLRRVPLILDDPELEKAKETNNERLLVSGMIGAISLIVALIAIIGGVLLIENAFVFLAILFTPLAIFVGIPLSIVLLIVYWKNRKMLEKGKTLFTEKFYYKAGRAALILSLFGLLFLMVGAAATLALLFTVGAAFGAATLGLALLLGASALLYLLHLVPTIALIMLSFDGSDHAGYALFILIFGIPGVFILWLIALLIIALLLVV